MKNTLSDKTIEALTKLQILVETLRDMKKGDPWILAQDFQSLASLTIEEAYEFADSVQQQDYAAMQDELGDLILHVFLYAQLGSEINSFDLSAIINSTLDKQARRKLNYNNPANISAEEALKLWDEKKAQEKKDSESVLDDITQALPALMKAEKLQVKAASVGFDWPEPSPIFDKLQEETLEFQNAIKQNNKDAMQDELGDLFFTLVNLARHYNVNPEAALRQANQKFSNRFQKLETAIQGKFSNYTLEQLDEIWESVKNK